MTVTQKYILDRLFAGAKPFPFLVRYWDGTAVAYGEGDPRFTLVFREKVPLTKWLRSPSLSFGEAYMDGIVDIEGKIEDLIELASTSGDLSRNLAPSALGKGISFLKEKKNVQHHYDVGNDFFALWLDETMSYSCAYFRSPEDSLEKAQLQKIDYILRKLQLRPGETLLDIGSGWGWLIVRAAKEYQVKAKGITLSEEQYKMSTERIAEQGLQDLAEVELLDYRQLAARGDQFDKIASVGMFEHVGQNNYPTFMKTVQSLVKDGGMVLLHTITQAKEIPTDPWIQKYIFPGGYIPSLREVVAFLPEFGFHTLDIENLRNHYAMTLDHWADRFENSTEQIRKIFDERFIRMWRLYLKSSAASFHLGNLHLHQILFSNGIADGAALTRDHLYQTPPEHAL